MRRPHNVKRAPTTDDRTARKRSRNSWTKNNAKRAIAVARETGVGQIEIGTPEGAKYTFFLNKTENEDQDRKRWDELTKQASVRNPSREGMNE
jgi:hypothetical protein